MEWGRNSNRESNDARRAQLRDLLEKFSAVNMDQIEQSLSPGGFSFESLVRDLVASGEVEELRPVFASDRWDKRQLRRHTYYRLCRPSDADYLWEQEACTYGQHAAPHIGAVQPRKQPGEWVRQLRAWAPCFGMKETKSSPAWV